MALPLLNVETIHPDLWRASQLGSAHGRTVTSGHEALDAELPGHGWPTGALTEVIVPQPGCGELHLLKAALEAVATRPVFVLQPQHRLQPAIRVIERMPARIFSPAEEFAEWTNIFGGRKPRSATASSIQSTTS